MIRTRLGSWHTLFLAALGTAPLGCGGATTSVETSPAPSGRGVTGGSGGVGVTGGSGGEPRHAKWSCTSPTPLTGVDTGYVHCAEGYTHRTKQVTCPSIYPRAGSQIPADASGGAAGGGAAGAAATGGSAAGSSGGGGAGGIQFACSEDADCKEKPHGYCQFYPAHEASPLGPAAPARTVCIYGCVTDQDCGAGSICQCGGNIGTCVASTCRTDADCADGSLCAGGTDYRPDVSGCGVERGNFPYSCQLPQEGAHFASTTHTARRAQLSQRAGSLPPYS
ncbi:MAG: hypothetical protein SFV15_15875 [Polyangiaceae bacterium]|nr:hypothetical protein [Polyangiaceae bacterium]